MDELKENDCVKIVKKDQCKKKGQKCMKSCNLCTNGGGTGECADELEGPECAKIVKKDQCGKKGDKCLKSCDMCNSGGGGDTSTTVPGSFPMWLNNYWIRLVD